MTVQWPRGLRLVLLGGASGLLLTTLATLGREWHRLSVGGRSALALLAVVAVGLLARASRSLEAAGPRGRRADSDPV